MKYYLSFIVLVIVVVFVNIKLYEQRSYSELANTTTDLVLDIARTNLESTKSNLLSIAISLASDKGLKEAIVHENNDKAYEILHSVASSISQNTLNENTKFQIITKDLYIFARSWDNIFYGMPIEDFRHDLSSMDTKPKVSIEVGRILSIFATVPIIENGEVLGYLEIIRLFDSFVESFRKFGIETFVLMDERYFENAVFMRDNDFLGNYVISHQNYSRLSYNIVKEIDWETLKQNKRIVNSEALILFEPIINSKSEEIGGFIYVVNRSLIDDYFNQKLAFYINLTSEDIVKISNILNKDEHTKAYNDMGVETLLNLYKREYNSVELSDALKNKLDKLEKDEIIKLIINVNKQNNITGEIE